MKVKDMKRLEDGSRQESVDMKRQESVDMKRQESVDTTYTQSTTLSDELGEDNMDPFTVMPTVQVLNYILSIVTAVRIITVLSMITAVKIISFLSIFQPIHQTSPTPKE